MPIPTTAPREAVPQKSGSAPFPADMWDWLDELAHAMNADKTVVIDELFRDVLFRAFAQMEAARANGTWVRPPGKKRHYRKGKIKG